jgi:hypothetical protein
MRTQTKICLVTAVMFVVALAGFSVLFFLGYDYTLVEQLTVIILGVFGVVLIFAVGDKNDENHK